MNNEITKKRISENHHDVSAENNPNYGNGEKISGDKNPMKNKEVALKLAQILKEKGHYDKKGTCIYCGKTFNVFMIRRWHNEKCKLKN